MQTWSFKQFKNVPPRSLQNHWHTWWATSMWAPSDASSSSVCMEHTRVPKSFHRSQIHSFECKLLHVWFSPGSSFSQEWDLGLSQACTYSHFSLGLHSMGWVLALLFYIRRRNTSPSYPLLRDVISKSLLPYRIINCKSIFTPSLSLLTIVASFMLTNRRLFHCILSIPRGLLLLSTRSNASTLGVVYPQVLRIEASISSGSRSIYFYCELISYFSLFVWWQTQGAKLHSAWSLPVRLLLTTAAFLNIADCRRGTELHFFVVIKSNHQAFHNLSQSIYSEIP